MLISGGTTFTQTASAYYQDPKDTVLTSMKLGEKRPITIILPKSFNRSKASKFPLIIVFDRQNQRIFRQTFEAINYLVSFDEMPEAVIIGISTQNNQQRYLETSLKTSTEKAKGEALIEFIYEELVPWAASALNCGSNRIFIGHSRFGFFTSYLLANKIHDLTGVISCSPFFVQPNVNIVDSLQERLRTARLNHTVYYRFVTGDSATDTPEYSLMNNMLRNTRPQALFNWKGTAFYNARHMAVPGLGVMPSLLEIFDYWSDETNKVLQDSLPFNSTRYDGFKRQMKQHYGAPLGLGLATLNGIGYKFYNQQQYSNARNAWQLLLEEYPQFTQAHISLANAYEKEGNKAEAIRCYSKAKQDLPNNPFYSQAQIQEMMSAIEVSLQSLRN